ncbi:MAG: sigma-70 family RNA polymerase sigma factor [Alphaproteobacteria bacterium]|nr:sigma-70 family RNA polymerase sigma factor [Alphaproteobacteria bacterium]
MGAKTRRSAISATFQESVTIPAVPLLTHEDYVELYKISPPSPEVIKRVVEANLPLVVLHAKKYTKRGLDLADLFQIGVNGLIVAAKNYDTSKAKFSTYASWWIKQKIKRALEEESALIRVPSNVYQEYARIVKVRHHHLKTYGTEMSDAQMQEMFGEKGVRVWTLTNRVRAPVSLSTPTGREDDRKQMTLQDIIPTKPKFDAEELHERMRIAARCSGHNGTAVQLLALDGQLGPGCCSLTLEDVANFLGIINRSRVAKIRDDVYEQCRRRAIPQDFKI